MTGLRVALAGHRRRLRLGRAAEAAARGAFAVSLAACAVLLAEKFLAFTLPRTFLFGALAAAPLALALRELFRSFSLRDCALALDRALGLDERLSTALEAAGPMKDALALDAAGALARAVLPARRMPREAKLLAGSGLLFLLLLIPASQRAAVAADPALVALTAEELQKLEALGKLDERFREAAALLKQGKAEEAFAKFDALREKLASERVEGAGAGTDEALKAAEGAAGALGAQLRRMGRPVPAARPDSVTRKLERQAVPAMDDRDPSGDAPARVRVGDGRGDWHPRYDAVIRKYEELRRKQ